jgi:AAHS family 4-hydroxybenzoate transporter-like MFS transporter
VTSAIDVGALLDRSPWTTYQKLLTAQAALAIIFDGFDIQILGFVIPSLMKEWSVSRATLAPVLALGLAGMVVGSPLAGYCGDRFGRRSALIGSIILFGCATATTALAHSVAMLAVLRFITGMGAGGALPNASALAAEFAPARRRPTAVKLTVICIPLGGMLGGLIAARVLPAFGWRALYCIGGAAPLLFAFVLWALLPESPRFLAKRPSGWAALRRFLTRAGHTVQTDSAFEDTSESHTANRSPIKTLFSPAHRSDTAGLCVSFFFCMSAIYLVFSWLPTLLATEGLNVSAASTGLAVYNFGGVLGMLLWAVLMTALGSRRPLLGGCLVGAVSALAILLVTLQAPAQRPLLLMAIGLQGLLANAVQTSLYALAAYVYPTSVRASGVAFTSASGRVGGLVSSLFGAAIIGAGAGAYWGAIAVALLFACGGVALVRSHFAPLRSSRTVETVGAIAR